MGARDYVCMVQRNGQNLHGLLLIDPVEKEQYDSDEERDDDYEAWDDTPGACTATLVRVPDTLSIREILSWPLFELAQYPTVECNYSWGDWEFDKAQGWGDASMSGHCQGSGWRGCIWKSEDWPGEWLINFDPVAYRVFVLGEGKDRVPVEYYRMVFHNRDCDCPDSVEDCYRAIVDSGKHNLFDYDGCTLQPVPHPVEHEALVDRVGSLPLFSHTFSYRLSDTPAALSKARITVLISDCAGRAVQDSRLSVSRVGCKQYVAGGDSIFLLGYSPEIPLYSDRQLQDCLYEGCDRARWKGSYLCHKHSRTEDEQAWYESCCRDVAGWCEQSRDSIEGLLSCTCPQTLAIQLCEKGVAYTLLLVVE